MTSFDISGTIDLISVARFFADVCCHFVLDLRCYYLDIHSVALVSCLIPLL